MDNQLKFLILLAVITLVMLVVAFFFLGLPPRNKGDIKIVNTSASREAVKRYHGGFADGRKRKPIERDSSLGDGGPSSFD